VAFLDEIRDRVPISDVIGQRVSWDREDQRAARRLLGLLPVPWREERRPSTARTSKGRYHCFGCGVTGDHFRFLTELDGMSFPRSGARSRRHGRRADAGARRAGGAREKERASLTT
jgi:DNA primase